MTSAMGPQWSAIVLTGGTGARLGGRDKAGLLIDGHTLLDLVLDSLPDGVDVVVAGPPRPTQRPVRFRQESPPRGGPVAGIAAALPEVSAPIVAIIAVDVPRASALVERAVGTLANSQSDAVVPIDADGHRRWLCSAWRTAALGSAITALGDPRDRAMRDLLGHAVIQDLPLSPSESDETLDIDTPADLQREQRRASSPSLGCASLTTAAEGEPSMDEWIDAVRRELDLDADVDVDAILDVARVAAHSVARPAAPVTTYLLGVAAARGADVAAAARAIDALAEGWTRDE